MNRNSDFVIKYTGRLWNTEYCDKDIVHKDI